mmetsp:Transcript_49757/g.53703  ORF Transcript_49757/g.53703 Transcript_49757/m.53703 type:complete len:814 (+) Transcript_49757:93-2534(+)
MTSELEKVNNMFSSNGRNSNRKVDQELLVIRTRSFPNRSSTRTQQGKTSAATYTAEVPITNSRSLNIRVSQSSMNDTHRIDVQDEFSLEAPNRTVSSSEEEIRVPPSSSTSTTSSFTEAAAAIPPSVLTRQRSTPGAICVPGFAGYDDQQNDNLLDIEEAREGDDDNDRNCDSNYLTTTPTDRDRGTPTTVINPALSNIVQSPESTAFASYSNGTTDGTMTNLSIPIIAELAPSYSYSEEDIEERLAERMEAQISERLKHGVEQEVHRRLSQDSRQHAIAIVSKKNNYLENKKGNDKKKDENFKICGIRRTSWGMILCVIMLFVIGGVAGTVLWFSRVREEKENNSKNEHIDVRMDMGPSQQPSFVPTSTLPIMENTPSLSTEPADNKAKVPVDIITFESNTPSTTPSMRSLVDRRQEFLKTHIGPYIVPDDFVDDPEKYFVADTDDARYAALNWIATLDLETDVFDMPIQLLVERYVLAVLYYTTGGLRTWNDKLSFLSSKDVCEWNNDNNSIYLLEEGIFDDNITGGNISITDEGNDDITVRKGVFCDSTRHVTIIKLPSNSLQGEMPWELSLLKNLIQVDFDSDQLYGSIPANFGNLSFLQALWLKGNDISGTLPPELAKATKLESLDLEDNSLTSILPSEWGSLSNLFYISLRLNSITGTLPAEWQGLTSLRIFDLDGNQLDGTLPKVYGKLSELTSLYFESNRFQGTLPNSWGNLTNLVNLFVDDNVLSGTVPDYTTLTNLEYFWFQGNMLTGSVDETFCDDSYLLINGTNMRSNCLIDDLAGLPAQIECSCCTTCCHRDGTGCVANM